MSTQEPTAVPLTEVESGKEVIVIGFASGRGAVDHFAQLGIHPGTKLRVLTSGGTGPVTIAAGQRRMDIGRGMADKLLVS
jgi:ferrous iron transport protein A